MANTYARYTGDGSTTDFTYSFSYDPNLSEIIVKINTVETTAYTIPSEGIIRFNTAPALDDLIEIQRETYSLSRLVDFQNGSILTESILDKDSNQLFNLIEEGRDLTVLKQTQDAFDYADEQDQIILQEAKDYTDLFNLNSDGEVFKETYTATEGQTNFNLVNTYLPNKNLIQVYINGVYQQSGSYTETDNQNIDFSEGLSEGMVVEFIWLKAALISSGQIDYKNVVNKPYSTILEYGAAGDGINDDTLAIQNAINNSYNSKLYFPKGTYKITSTIEITGDIDLEFEDNAIIDGSNIPASTTLSEFSIFKGYGTIGLEHSLTIDLLENNYIATIADTSSYSVGDIVLFKSNEFYSTGVSTGSNKQGWICKITEIVSPTEIRIDTKSYADMLVSDSATIQKINPITINITNGEFIGGGVGDGHDGIVIKYGKNCNISNTIIKKSEGVALYIDSCYNTKVDNIVVEDSTSPSALGNTGYGVAPVNGSTLCNITNSYFRNCRHAISGGGTIPVRHVKVSNNYIVECGISTQAVDCHEPCFLWDFEGNHIFTSSERVGGMIIRGKNINIINNTIYGDINFGGDILIKSYIPDTNKQTNINIEGNVLKGSRSGITLDNEFTSFKNITIHNNKIDNAYFNGVYCNDVINLSIIDNVIDNIDYNSGTSGNAIDVRNSSNINIISNKISDTEMNNIRLDTCGFVNVNNNLLSGKTIQPVVNVVNTNDLNLNSNNIVSSIGIIFFLTDSNRVVVNNNIGSLDIVSGNYDFIRASATSSDSLTINGNKCSGNYRYGIYTTGYDNINVVSNNFTDATGIPVIFLSGATNTLIIENSKISTIGDLSLTGIPTYTDDASAGTGGLISGDVYKTATGELRIKL